MFCLTLKVLCCRMVLTLGCHPDICAKKKSSPNLSHCGHSFYITASSVEQRTALKARLADLVHLYCDSTIDSRDFTMYKECFRAINRLRKNDDIIVTRDVEAVIFQTLPLPLPHLSLPLPLPPLPLPPTKNEKTTVDNFF